MPGDPALVDAVRPEGISSATLHGVVHVPAGAVPPVDYGNPFGCSAHGFDRHPGCWDCVCSQSRLDQVEQAPNYLSHGEKENTHGGVRVKMVKEALFKKVSLTELGVEEEDPQRWTLNTPMKDIEAAAGR